MAFNRVSLEIINAIKEFNELDDNSAHRHGVEHNVSASLTLVSIVSLSVTPGPVKYMAYANRDVDGISHNSLGDTDLTVHSKPTIASSGTDLSNSTVDDRSARSLTTTVGGTTRKTSADDSAIRHQDNTEGWIERSMYGDEVMTVVKR